MHTLSTPSEHTHTHTHLVWICHIPVCAAGRGIRVGVGPSIGIGDVLLNLHPSFDLVVFVPLARGEKGDGGVVCGVQDRVDRVGVCIGHKPGRVKGEFPVWLG